ncbi:MAG TPA: universal stress protein, partial [Gammaproteobacteria bacterium]|nr:universal stress protein [Gammaproteobacteria bacterium]
PASAAAADSMTAAIAAPVRDIAAAVEQRHREALETLLAEFPTKPEKIHLEEGAPHETLVRTADKLHADFVVMGAVSRSALKRVFIGSTAERVLDRLTSDLFVIKPVGFDGRRPAVKSRSSAQGADV